MSDTNNLAIQEQRMVLFYEDELTAVRAEDGQIYVGFNQLCNIFGLDSQGQRRRIARHAVLSEGLKGVAKLSTPSGGAQFAYVLRSDFIPLWLSGVRASAVKEEIRPKLVKFQIEAARVLAEAFRAGELTTSEDDLEMLAAIDPQAAEALATAQAVVKLAKAHIRLVRTVHENRQDIDAQAQRIEAIEANLGNTDRFVTTEQASNISQAVKSIALELSRASGKNEFGGVYGEMYRRMGVTSYKEIPANKYEDVMGWLREWWGSISDESIHF